MVTAASAPTDAAPPVTLPGGHGRAPATPRLGAWLVGAAALAAVIFVARHVADERAFLRIVETARPGWLIVAILLQVLTYAAQGAVWRTAARAVHVRLSIADAYKLSLAKLFVDQALPSGGVSGTFIFARALKARGAQLPAVMTCAIVAAATYWAAYAVALTIALAAALVVASTAGRITIPFAAVTVALIFGAGAASAGLLALAGRSPPRWLCRRMRLKPLARLLELAQIVDVSVARAPRVLSRAAAFHVLIVLLDSSTMWFLLLALGTIAPPAGVFVSFMTSTVFRTIGVVPGGLGTFDAAAVVTLSMVGVPVAVALSAVIAFRVLGFWLPMIPGLLFARQVERPATARASLDPAAWWSLAVPELSRALCTSPAMGLSTAEAARRLERLGPNDVDNRKGFSRPRAVWEQLRNPLVILLVFASAVSAATGEWADAAIVVGILFMSAAVGSSREHHAHVAARELQRHLQPRASVVRDGEEIVVPTREIVPGDVLLLSAGSLVPADGRILEATDFFVNEAVLTGESFPVEKTPAAAAEQASLGERVGSVFLGANVHSGSARCLVVVTGEATALGSIARGLTARPPETSFDRGTRQFGTFLLRAMLVMIVIVFTANVLLDRPVAETLLFSLALAVGLSPELLPAILSVSLARGARMMATHGVLVRRLPGIENLGSMDVLCTDKTGTLTEGVVSLGAAHDVAGERSNRVLELGVLNATLQAGFKNPLDEALLRTPLPGRLDVVKLGEVPWDFVRKRMSVVVQTGGEVVLISKGAVGPLLERCVRTSRGSMIDTTTRGAIDAKIRQWTSAGTRVIAVATRVLPTDATMVTREDESELTLEGFLTFVDAPKEGVAEAISALRRLGVTVKVITGDAELVARHVAGEVGLPAERVLTGKQLDELVGEALGRAAGETDLFVEVDPNQKERIILALRKQGHIVGFLGDGVNDAPAMHAADTSISVDDAVEVARQAADFVLLKRDLDVIRRGIEEGRRIFANTLKYVLTTTSANLGNMISMAAASLALPFLPLTAGQILLNNFLSDIPAIGIAGDSVDPELVDRPRRWDMPFIRRFMVEFGLLSSLFDFATFGALLFWFQADIELFRTAWFVESLLTELVIALAVRTGRRLTRSRPGSFLLISSIVLMAVSLAIPFSCASRWLGFVPLPGPVVVCVVAIAGAYVLAVEALKGRVFRGWR